MDQASVVTYPYWADCAEPGHRTIFLGVDDQIRVRTGRVDPDVARKLVALRWTHDDIAAAMGVKRPAVSNSLRRNAAKQPPPDHATELPWTLPPEILATPLARFCLHHIALMHGETLSVQNRRAYDTEMALLRETDEGCPMGMVIFFRDGCFHYRARTDRDYPEPFARE